MDSDGRHQFELLPTGASDVPHVEPVTPSLIAQICRRRTFLDAWKYAQDFSCLQDKQCYDPLAIDSSHWSKIRKGNASPPADERFVKYFDVVKNEFPLIWLAESRGYDWTTIRKHQDDKDREIARLRQTVAAQDHAMRMWVEAQKGARP
jgi:hypothetical protein